MYGTHLWVPLWMLHYKIDACLFYVMHLANKCMNQTKIFNTFIHYTFQTFIVLYVWKLYNLMINITLRFVQQNYKPTICKVWKEVVFLNSMSKKLNIWIHSHSQWWSKRKFVITEKFYSVKKQALKKAHGLVCLVCLTSARAYIHYDIF